MRNKLALTIALASFWRCHGPWRRLGRRRTRWPTNVDRSRPADDHAAGSRRCRPPACCQRPRRRRRRPRRPRRPRLRSTRPTPARNPARQRRPPAEAPAPPPKRRPATGNPRGRRRASTPARPTATTASGDGVTHNESLGDASGGGGDRRRRHAPRARPAAATSRRPKAPTAARQFGNGGSPDRRQPDDDDRALRPGPDRRPQLRHRLLRDPALPAADLPGLRNRVRDPLGGARLDQQNRDRLRHQPQRLQRRRRRLDAVPPLELGSVRRRRQRRRAQGPLQPGRRDLRRRPLPQGRPAATRTSTTRSSPTTTPTGTCRRCCSTPAPTASCPPTWSAR